VAVRPGARSARRIGFVTRVTLFQDADQLGARPLDIL
jgi:hypothetical protein